QHGSHREGTSVGVIGHVAVLATRQDTGRAQTLSQTELDSTGGLRVGGIVHPELAAASFRCATTGRLEVNKKPRRTARFPGHRKLGIMDLNDTPRLPTRSGSLSMPGRFRGICCLPFSHVSNRRSSSNRAG